jgi:hypothetical protein
MIPQIDKRILDPNQKQVNFQPKSFFNSISGFCFGFTVAGDVSQD